jgi:hypothetical protein
MSNNSSEKMASNAKKLLKNLNTIFEIKIGKMGNKKEKELEFNRRHRRRYYLTQYQNEIHKYLQQIQKGIFHLALQGLNNLYNNGEKIFWN